MPASSTPARSGFVDLLEGMTEHLERGVDTEPAETAVEADVAGSSAARRTI